MHLKSMVANVLFLSRRHKPSILFPKLMYDCQFTLSMSPVKALDSNELINEELFSIAKGGRRSDVNKLSVVTG